jgi:hypothetical protein
MIVSMLANCHRDSNKHPAMFQPWDFFSNLRDCEPQSSEEDQIEAFKLLMGYPGTPDE